MNNQLAAGSPATSSGQAGSDQQVIKSRNPESRGDTAQGARHTEYIGQRFSFGPEPYALILKPLPKAN